MQTPPDKLELGGLKTWYYLFKTKKFLNNNVLHVYVMYVYVLPMFVQELHHATLIKIP